MLWRRHPWLIAIGSADLLLGIVYAFTTPLFEAPDELYHYAFATYLADGKGLPPLDVPMRQHRIGQEVGQPPLYYAGAALVIAALRPGNTLDAFRFNPHAAVGVPDVFPGNRNLVVARRADRVPHTRLSLAVHLIRLLSVCLGLVAVVATYALALALRPLDHAFTKLAAAFTAFNPQFVFISASVNNDNVIDALAAVTLLLVIRGLDTKLSWRFPLGLGLLTGLATLGKADGLALVAVVGVGFLWIAWRQRSLSWLVRASATYLGVVVVLIGPWLVYNVRAWGNPFGIVTHLPFVGRAGTVGLGEVLAEAPSFWLSFWGVFGAFSILAPPEYYAFFDDLCLLAAFGLALGFAVALRTGRWRTWFASAKGAAPPALKLGLVAGWLTLILALLVRYSLLVPAAQGRLAFPAIASVSILLALGLVQLPVAKPALVGAIGACLVATAAAVPFSIIRPGYPQAPILTDPSRAAIQRPVGVGYTDQMSLLGYTVEQLDRQWFVGTFCWQSTAPTPRDYSLFIHVQDLAGTSLGQIDTYPGLGSYYTSQLSPGDIVCDRYRIPLKVTGESPVQVQLRAGVYSDPTAPALYAHDRLGQVIGDAPIVGVLDVHPPVGPPGSSAEPAVFGNRISLLGSELPSPTGRPGQPIAGKLFLTATKPIDRDYGLWVDLLHTGTMVATWSAEPRGGQLPTSVWATGEVVDQDFSLVVPANAPAGTYQITAGVFDRQTGVRLEMGSGTAALVRDVEIDPN
jgi:hypothetical protein